MSIWQLAVPVPRLTSLVAREKSIRKESSEPLVTVFDRLSLV